jgi:hypothetical protein
MAIIGPACRRILILGIVFSLLAPPPAYTRENEVDFSGDEISETRYPHFVLREADEFNRILAAQGFETRAADNMPADLALASVFFEAASKNLPEEELVKLTDALKLRRQYVTLLLNISYEGKINADILLEEARPSDSTALAGAFSGYAAVDFLAAPASAGSRSIHLAAMAALVYDLAPAKTRDVAKALGLEIVAFESQTGIAARFVETLHLLKLSPNLGFAAVDSWPKADTATPAPAGETGLLVPEAVPPATAAPRAGEIRTEKIPPRKMRKVFSKEKAQIKAIERDLQTLGSQVADLEASDPERAGAGLPLLRASLEGLRKDFNRIARSLPKSALASERKGIFSAAIKLETALRAVEDAVREKRARNRQREKTLRQAQSLLEEAGNALRELRVHRAETGKEDLESIRFQLDSFSKTHLELKRKRARFVDTADETAGPKLSEIDALLAGIETELSLWNQSRERVAAEFDRKQREETEALRREESLEEAEWRESERVKAEAQSRFRAMEGESAAEERPEEFERLAGLFSGQAAAMNKQAESLSNSGSSQRIETNRDAIRTMADSLAWKARDLKRRAEAFHRMKRAAEKAAGERERAVREARESNASLEKVWVEFKSDPSENGLAALTRETQSAETRAAVWREKGAAFALSKTPRVSGIGNELVRLAEENDARTRHVLEQARAAMEEKSRESERAGRDADEREALALFESIEGALRRLQEEEQALSSVSSADALLAFVRRIGERREKTLADLGRLANRFGSPEVDRLGEKGRLAAAQMKIIEDRWSEKERNLRRLNEMEAGEAEAAGSLNRDLLGKSEEWRAKLERAEFPTTESLQALRDEIRAAAEKFKARFETLPTEIGSAKTSALQEEIAGNLAKVEGLIREAERRLEKAGFDPALREARRIFDDYGAVAEWTEEKAVEARDQAGRWNVQAESFGKGAGAQAGRELKEMAERLEGLAQSGLSRRGEAVRQRHEFVQSLHDQLAGERARLEKQFAENRRNAGVLNALAAEFESKLKPLFEALAALPQPPPDAETAAIYEKISRELVTLEQTRRDVASRVAQLAEAEVFRQQEEPRLQGLAGDLNAALAKHGARAAEAGGKDAGTLRAWVDEIGRDLENLGQALGPDPAESLSEKIDGLRREVRKSIAELEVLSQTIGEAMRAADVRRTVREKEENQALEFLNKIRALLNDFEAREARLENEDEIRSLDGEIQAARRSLSVELKGLANVSGSPAAGGARDEAASLLEKMSAAEARVSGRVTETDAARLQDLQKAEQAAAKSLYTAVEEDLQNMESVVSAPAGGKADLLQPVLAEAARKRAAHLSRFEKIANTTESAVVAFLIEKISAMLEKWLAVQGELQKKIEDLRARESVSEEARPENAPAAGSGTVQEVLRAKSLYNDLEGELQDLDDFIKGMAEKDTRELSEKVWETAGRQARASERFAGLSNEAGSPVVAYLREKIPVMIARFVETEQTMRARLKEMGVADLPPAPPDPARDFREKLEAAGTEHGILAADLDAKGLGELRALMARLEAEGNALQAEYEQLKAAGALGDFEGPARAELEKLTGIRTRVAGRLEDAARVAAKAGTFLGELEAGAAQMKLKAEGLETRTETDLKLFQDEAGNLVETFDERWETARDKAGADSRKKGDELLRTLKEIRARVGRELSGRIVKSETEAKIKRLTDEIEAAERPWRGRMEALNRGHLGAVEKALEETREVQLRLAGLRDELSGLNAEEASEAVERAGALIREVNAEEEGLIRGLAELREIELGETAQAEKILKEAGEQYDRQRNEIAGLGNDLPRLEAKQTELEALAGGLKAVRAGLANSAGSAAIEGIGRKLDLILGNLDEDAKALRTRRERLIRDEEEARAKALQDRVSKTFATATALVREMEGKSAGEMERASAGLKQDREIYLGEFEALSNRTDSGLVRSLADKISAMLEELVDSSRRIEEASGRAREKEAAMKRNAAAEEFNRKLTVTAERWQERSQTLDSLSVAELDRIKSDLSSALAPLTREFSQLTERKALKEARKETSLMKGLIELQNRIETRLREHKTRTARDESQALALMEKSESMTRGWWERLNTVNRADITAVQGALGDARNLLAGLKDQRDELKDLRAAPAREGLGKLESLISAVSADERGLAQGLERLRETARRETSQAEKILKEAGGEYNRQAKETARAGGDLPRLEARQKELEACAARLKAAGAGLANSAGSPAIEEIRKKIDLIGAQILKDAETVRTKRERLVRGEEEGKAKLLHRRVSEETGHLASLMKGLERKSAADIERIWDGMKRERETYLGEFEALSNRTDSALVKSLVEKLSEMLEGLVDASKVLEKALETARARERQANAEAEAGKISQTAARLLSEIRAAASRYKEMTLAQLDALEAQIKEAVQKVQHLFDEIARFRPTETIAQIKETLLQNLAELETFSGTVKARIGELRERQEILEREEGAAKDLREELAGATAEFETFEKTLGSRGPLEIKARIEEIGREKEFFSEKFKALPDTAGSSSVAAMEREILRLLEDLDRRRAGWEHAREKANLVTRRAEALAAKLRDLKGQIEGPARAEDAEAADLRSVHENTVRLLEEYRAEAAQLDFPYLGELAIQEMIGEISSMSGAVTERIRILDERRADVDRTRQIVSDSRLASERLMTEFGQSDRADPAALERFEGEMIRLAGSLEAAVAGMANRTGFAAIDANRKTLSELAAGLRKQADGLARERIALGERRAKEQDQATRELAAARKEWEDLLAEKTEPAVTAEKFKTFGENLKKRNEGIQNQSRSPEIDRLKAEISGLAGKAVRRGLGAGEKTEAVRLAERAREELRKLEEVSRSTGDSDLEQLRRISSQGRSAEALLRKEASGLANTAKDPGIEEARAFVAQAAGQVGNLSRQLSARLERAEALAALEARQALTLAEGAERQRALVLDLISAAQSSRSKQDALTVLEDFRREWSEWVSRPENRFDSPDTRKGLEICGAYLKELKGEIDMLEEDLAKQEKLEAATLSSYAESKLSRLRERRGALSAHDRESRERLVEDVRAENEVIRGRASELSDYSSSSEVSASIERVKSLLGDLRQMERGLLQELEKMAERERLELGESLQALESAKSIWRRLKSAQEGLDASSSEAFDLLIKQFKQESEALSIAAQKIVNSGSYPGVEENRRAIQLISAGLGETAEKLGLEKDFLLRRHEEEFESLQALNRFRARALESRETMSGVSFRGSAQVREWIRRVSELKAGLGRTLGGLADTTSSTVVRTHRNKMTALAGELDADLKYLESRLAEWAEKERVLIEQSRRLLEEARAAEERLNRGLEKLGGNDLPGLKNRIARLRSDLDKIDGWKAAPAGHEEIESNAAERAAIRARLGERLSELETRKKRLVAIRGAWKKNSRFRRQVESSWNRMMSEYETLASAPQADIPALERFVAAWKDAIASLSGESKTLENPFGDAEVDEIRRSAELRLTEISKTIAEAEAEVVRLKELGIRERNQAAETLRGLKKRQESLFVPFAAEPDFEKLRSLLPEVEALALDLETAVKELANHTGDPAIEEVRRILKALADETGLIAQTKRMQLELRRRDEEENQSVKSLDAARSAVRSLQAEFEAAGSAADWKFWNGLLGRAAETRKNVLEKVHGLTNESKSLLVELNKGETLNLASDLDGLIKGAEAQLERLEQQRAGEIQAARILQEKAVSIREALIQESQSAADRDLAGLEARIEKLTLQAAQMAEWADRISDVAGSEEVSKSREAIRGAGESLLAEVAKLEEKRSLLVRRQQQAEEASRDIEWVRQRWEDFKAKLQLLGRKDPGRVAAALAELESFKAEADGRLSHLPKDAENPALADYEAEAGALGAELAAEERNLRQIDADLRQRSEELKRTEALLAEAGQKAASWRRRLSQIREGGDGEGAYRELRGDFERLAEEARGLGRRFSDPEIEAGKKKIELLSYELIREADEIRAEMAREEKRAEEEAYSRDLLSLVASELEFLKRYMKLDALKDRKKLESFLAEVRERRRLFQNKLSAMPDTASSPSVQADRAEIEKRLDEISALESEMSAQMESRESLEREETDRSFAVIKEVAERKRRTLEAAQKLDRRDLAELRRFIYQVDTEIRDIARLEDSLTNAGRVPLIEDHRREVHEALAGLRSLKARMEEEKSKLALVGDEEALSREIAAFAERESRASLEKASSPSTLRLDELETLQKEQKELIQLLYRRIAELPEQPASALTVENLMKVTGAIGKLIEAHETISEKIRGLKKLEGPELLESIRILEQARKVEADLEREKAKIEPRDRLAREALGMVLRSQAGGLKREAELVSNRAGNEEVGANAARVQEIAQRLLDEAARLTAEGPSGAKEPDEEAARWLSAARREIVELRTRLRAADEQAPDKLLEAVRSVEAGTVRILQGLRQWREIDTPWVHSDKVSLQIMTRSLSEEIAQAVLRVVRGRAALAQSVKASDRELRRSFRILEKIQPILEEVYSQLKWQDGADLASADRLAGRLREEASRLAAEVNRLPARPDSAELRLNLEILRLISRDLEMRADEVLSEGRHAPEPSAQAA